MKIHSSFFALPLVMMIACRSGESEVKNTKGNPPEEGFNLAASDPAAVELADSVMSAMGGRSNWDNTNFISWTSENRNLTWDKTNGRIRIEVPDEHAVYLINTSGKGSASINGTAITQADSLEKTLQRATGAWKKDSYSLLMPFQLKGAGLTLKYLGEDTLSTGGKCNVMELTGDGDAAGKRLLVYVDLNDNLVKQWLQINGQKQDSVDFIRPWDNYKRYGNILLSADRSDGNGPKNVKVEKELPDKLFTDF